MGNPSHILSGMYFRQMHSESLNIVAADETPCWMDMPLGKTIEKKGSKTIKVKTTGHEKNRYCKMQ